MLPNYIWFYGRIHCRINKQCSLQRWERFFFFFENFPYTTLQLSHQARPSVESTHMPLSVSLFWCTQLFCYISFPEPVTARTQRQVGAHTKENKNVGNEKGLIAWAGSWVVALGKADHFIGWWCDNVGCNLPRGNKHFYLYCCCLVNH